MESMNPSAMLLRLGRGAEVVKLARTIFRGVSNTEVPGLGSLTTRELEIVVRLMGGDRPPPIAEGLFLSQSTVRNLLGSVREARLRRPRRALEPAAVSVTRRDSLPIRDVNVRLVCLFQQRPHRLTLNLYRVAEQVETLTGKVVSPTDHQAVRRRSSPRSEGRHSSPIREPRSPHLRRGRGFLMPRDC